MPTEAISMRERLAAKPQHEHATGAVIPNAREVAFMLRVRAHLADEKLWLRNGEFFPRQIVQQIDRGLYVPIDETPSCLIGTAMLLQGIVHARESTWGEKVIKHSMGFTTWQDVYRFNDTCTHSELLSRIDRAIVGLQTQEPMEATPCQSQLGDSSSSSPSGSSSAPSEE